MLGFSPRSLIEEIESQAILTAIVLLQQSSAKNNPVLLPHDAFKNRFLDARAVVFALAGDSAQSAPPLGRLRTHVISNQNKHSEI